MTGHQAGEQDRECLEACLAARDAGKAIFPISDTIYFEVSKIKAYRQRCDLRDVIETLSQYTVVTSRSVISTHEVETMLDDLVGPSERPINSMSYLDWGIARALGRAGGFNVVDDTGADLTQEVRSEWDGGPEAFDALFSAAELMLQRQVLAGPSPEEEPLMRTYGWNPAGAFEIPARRAEQELEQVARFDDNPRWRRGRIRDVVSTREILIEIHDTLFTGLADRGHAQVEDLLGTPNQAREAFDSMPSFDVAVTLKTEYHRDPNHRWTVNDIHDIDALGSTIPYCDIVVTDKAVANHAVRTGLDERFDTQVLSQLAHLVDLL